jgi:hypothetical protein
MRIVPLPWVALATAALLPAQKGYVPQPSPAQPQLSVPSVPAAQPAGDPMGSGEVRELSAAEKEAQKFRRLQVRGQHLTRAVDTVVKALTWHDKLADAARVAKETGKPILWIQALGTLQGYT